MKRDLFAGIFILFIVIFVNLAFLYIDGYSYAVEIFGGVEFVKYILAIVLLLAFIFSGAHVVKLVEEDFYSKGTARKKVNKKSRARKVVKKKMKKRWSAIRKNNLFEYLSFKQKAHFTKDEKAILRKIAK